MTVKKCDKCGSIYGNGYLLEFKMHETFGVETVPSEERYTTVDLCNKCKDEFYKWISSQPKENE